MDTSLAFGVNFFHFCGVNINMVGWIIVLFLAIIVGTIMLGRAIIVDPPVVLAGNAVVKEIIDALRFLESSSIIWSSGSDMANDTNCRW